MQKFIYTIIFLSLTMNLSAQGKSKRYSFAKSYFGVDALYTPSYGVSSFLDDEGNLNQFERSAYITPSINIGATHFWGYADFYVSINTANFTLKETPVKAISDAGVFTGLRLYPWQLTDHNLRPFVGYKFSAFWYDQENLAEQSSSLTMVRSILDIGVGYRLPSAYIYLGYNRVMNPEVKLPISRTQFTQTNIPKQFFNFGVNWMIETTNTSQTETFQNLNTFFSSSNKHGLYFGVGPSSAFPILKSSHIQEKQAFLDDLAMPGIFVDFSAGYHLSKQDISIGLAYRPINQFRGAFDFKQLIKRKSLVLEGFKFLGDYHGFAPFIGGGLSYENLQLLESDGENLITDERQNYITPIITFGWDIRPGIKMDPWLLRTNLRYAPLLNFDRGDSNLSLQHLEFNFIQLVVYPGRMRVIRKMRKK